MPIALTPDESFEYQLIEDRVKDVPDPQGTYFSLGALTPQDEAEIADRAVTYGTDGRVANVNTFTCDLLRCERGLKGWRNFHDKAGAPVLFKTRAYQNGRLVADCLERLTLAQRHELSNAIASRNRLTPIEGN